MKQKQSGALGFLNNYKKFRDEENFLKGTAQTYNRLTKIRELLGTEARVILGYGTTYIATNPGMLLDAASDIKAWLAFYDKIKYLSGEARGGLAGMALFALEKDLPDWSIDYARLKKQATLAIAPMVKKDGKQVIVQVKFPTIHKFDARIGVPWATIKFQESYSSEQIEKFMEDARTFLSQLLRLR